MIVHHNGTISDMEREIAARRVAHGLMKEYLERCAATFRRYEQSHMKKGTSDGAIKASENAFEAMRIEALLGVYS